MLATDVPAFNTHEYSLYLKLELKRTHREYQHIPVDKICKKHWEEGAENHPIQMAQMEPEHKYNASIDGAHLWFKCEEPKHPEGLIEEKVSLCFPCNDSCGKFKHFHNFFEFEYILCRKFYF